MPRIEIIFEPFPPAHRFYGFVHCTTCTILNLLRSKHEMASLFDDWGVHLLSNCENTHENQNPIKL